MHAVLHWLGSLPPGLVYLVIAVVIGVESMGVPLPGEITLVSGALLAASGQVDIAPVACAATTGAILGDSAGYYLGHRGGRAGRYRAAPLYSRQKLSQPARPRASAVPTRRCWRPTALTRSRGSRRSIAKCQSSTPSARYGWFARHACR